MEGIDKPLEVMRLLEKAEQFRRTAVRIEQRAMQVCKHTPTFQRLSVSVTFTGSFQCNWCGKVLVK